VLTISEGCEDRQRVPILSSLCIEGASGAKQGNPVLKCPLGLVVAGGAGTKVLLRNLILEAAPGQDAVLELRKDVCCEVSGCRLRGGGIRLGEGASLKLSKSEITNVHGAGISGCGFTELCVESTEIRSCSGDGMRLGKGSRVLVKDCNLLENQGSGAVFSTFGEGSWEFRGCTLSKNGQYGVWADAGTRVSWGQNSIGMNALGEKGGRGDLAGWSMGIAFRPEDECSVWSEEHRAWLPGLILTLSGLHGMNQTTVAVNTAGRRPVRGLACRSGRLLRRSPAASSEDAFPDHSVRHRLLKKTKSQLALGVHLRRLRSKTTPELEVAEARAKAKLLADAKAGLADGSWRTLAVTTPDMLRQPRSGEPGAPSSFLAPAQALRRSQSALQLFMQEAGMSRESWEQLPAGERHRFEELARGERRASTSSTKAATIDPLEALAAKRRRAVAAHAHSRKKPRVRR